MTKLVFTYAGTHNPDGRYATHLYVKQLSETIGQLDDASASLTLSIFEAANDSVTPEERKLILRGK